MKNLQTPKKSLELETTFEEIKPTSSNENTEIFKVEEIEGTPFSVVEENGEYFGVCGMNRITESKYTDKEKCIEDTKAITWERIQQVLWIVTKKLNKIENEQ